MALGVHAGDDLAERTPNQFENCNCIDYHGNARDSPLKNSFGDCVSFQTSSFGRIWMALGGARGEMISPSAPQITYDLAVTDMRCLVSTGRHFSG